MDAYEGEAFDAVSEQNKKDIGKGLTQQSYHISAGIGAVDAFLREHEETRDEIIESHPELCFRGLLGRQLQHSKKTAAGIGERLGALGDQLDDPGTLLAEVAGDLVDGLDDGDVDEIELDDVVDAMGLGVTAMEGREGLLYLPKDWKRDYEKLPMRMAYRGDSVRSER